MTKKLLTTILLSLILLGLMAAFISRLDGEGEAPAASGLRLNEIMASNKGSVPDGYGGYPDWIELHNPAGEALDISGFGLSDSLLDGAKYVFPAGTQIEAGGYAVVYCSGGAESAFHAPFKINSSEEAILFDAAGRALDTATLKAVASGHTLSRSGEVWEDMPPSPGYPNTAEGIAAYESTLTETEDVGLYINEFMASNSTTVADSFGNYSDWIELYNSTSSDMDISGFGVSDSAAQPMKYQIPEGVTVPAGGYLLIFCSGNEGLFDGELHAPFGLKAYEEDVVISGRGGLVIDSFSYTRQDGDMAMARTPDGTGDFLMSAQPTPGYPNTSDGYAAFSEASRLPLSAVHISEFASASSVLTASGYGECDWVELHNGSEGEVDLSGYGLSNNPDNPAKWLFPEGTSLAPGEYLLLYATGEDKRSSKADLRLNFNISAGGEALFLFSPEGKLMDKLSAGSLPQGVSYGRDNADSRLYYTALTPGSANGEGYSGLTSMPSLGVNPGIYSEPIEVSISAGAGETIRYTTDCTTPNISSPVYSGPIPVGSNTVIRAAAFKEGALTGQTVSGTYLFTADEVNHSLPVATLVTDPDNLWDNETGIYAYGSDYDPSLPYGQMLETANFYEDGDEWERPASFAVFTEEGRQDFSQNVGISIAGAFGRGRAQKGFNVIARSAYGPNRMNYEFFPEDRGFGSYKAVVLRAGAQDQNRSKIRDELAVEILKGTDVNFLYQAYKPYVLYLNGEYWGVYFLREKRNRFFVAQHEGTENVDDMIIGKASTRLTYAADPGWTRNEEWVELMNWVKGHDLSSQANYGEICRQVDVDSFIDYMACEIYTGNTDTPNIQYYKLPSGKWKWIYYDFCWGFYSTDHQSVTFRRGSQPAASDLFNALLENQEFKDRFCRRFAELLSAAFAPENVSAAIDKLYACVEPEIRREREKFNQETFMGAAQPAECIGTYDGFIDEIGRLRSFAEGRPAAILENLQEELGLSDSYMQEVFG